MTLGECIRNERENLSLSQKELAKRLNISTSTLALWESDEESPSVNDISSLCSALNTSADILLNEDKNSESIFHKNKKNKKQTRKNKSKAIIAFLAILLLITVGLYFLFAHVFPFSKNTNNIDELTSSVVKIYCYDYFGEEVATGSGFVAFDESTIITNYHVMKEAYTCKISTEEDKTLNPSKIVCYSKEKDIAILSLSKSSGLKPLKIGISSNVKKGDKVIAIGSPLGIKNTVSEGIISGRYVEENMDVLNFTAPISSGSSGGALFDENGKVIGITYASYIEGQNLNLAIPIEEAQYLHDNEKHDYQINRIYTTNHPFVHHLEEKKEKIYDVSLSDLRVNPKKYNNKTIKLNCYVSSIRIQYADIDDSPTKVFSITDNARCVSDSAENDFELSQIYDFKKSNIILMDRTFSGFYEEKNLKPGDYICIIGEFKVLKKGQKTWDINDDLYILPSEQIRINKDVVYKIG